MPQIVFRFESLKKRFGELNQDVLDSFLQQHRYLSSAFNEALENFLLRNRLNQQEREMPVFTPTETTLPKAAEKSPLAPLPNAKQKEHYTVSTLSYGNVDSVTFSEDCGLSWHSETQEISGLPTVGGKEISVQFTFADGSQNTATLYINADPRSLWNNIPSEQLIKTHWKADSASGQKTTPFGKIIAARMRGRSHAHKGTCCDDDFSFDFHPATGIHFLAVADGAGSAEYSRLGSQVAVNRAKHIFFELLNDVGNNLKELPNQSDDKLEAVAVSLLYNAVVAAYKAQQEKVSSEITQKSLSCTLLLAFTLPLKSGKWFSAAYWVGDGAVALFDPNILQVRLLGESDGGQYSGETQFLSKAEFENDLWKSRIRTSLSEKPPVLFAMTDGVSDPKFKNDAALNQVEPWAALWTELQAPLSQTEPEKALEQWLDFWSVGEHDDRTLAVFIPNVAEKSEENSVCEASAPQENELSLTKPTDVIEEQEAENLAESITLPTVTLVPAQEEING